ncbi:hypothetical protein TNIN_305231 [Trichonephila inaurata madagascariensis]|uniref:Uncharacterized protein n=1 Tax=Trichonephila inaurata madagascariensis TaxID=2747483 RepID=A0A8X7CDP8_9ARAC|nr:hypothetical protein TNIN_305231 [Trichonephila inaurata madagascariensis]
MRSDRLQAILLSGVSTLSAGSSIPSNQILKFSMKCQINNKVISSLPDFGGSLLRELRAERFVDSNPDLAKG